MTHGYSSYVIARLVRTTYSNVLPRQIARTGGTMTMGCESQRVLDGMVARL